MYLCIEMDQRVQTGIKLDRQLLKLLKAMAAEMDISLSALVEMIARDACGGLRSFGPAQLRKVKQLSFVYAVSLPDMLEGNDPAADATNKDAGQGAGIAEGPAPAPVWPEDPNKTKAGEDDMPKQRGLRGMWRGAR